MKTFTNTKKLWLLLFLLAMMLGIPDGKAQGNAGIKHSISYKQTTTTFYEVNQQNRALLMEFEKVGMKSTEEVRNVSMVIDRNNDLSTTIEIMNSNANETWMTPPRKIVINKDGATFYNAQNSVMLLDSSSAEQVQQYAMIKNSIASNGIQGAPSFKALSAADISSLQQQGFNVQNLPGGIIQARKGDTEIKYNYSGLSYEVTDYEGEKVISQTIFNYQNSGGKTIPASRIERENQTSPSGVCLTFVTQTTYSNYNSSVLP